MLRVPSQYSHSNTFQPLSHPERRSASEGLTWRLHFNEFNCFTLSWKYACKNKNSWTSKRLLVGRRQPLNSQTQAGRDNGWEVKFFLT